jgi:fructosamine-3-kinase
MADALGAAIAEVWPVTGGSGGPCWRLGMSDGRLVFAKTHPDAPQGLFSAEADGLRWLATGGARIPNVLAHADGRLGFLALDWIEPGRAGPHTEEETGRMLARLHASGAPSFGHSRGNFIGGLPQANPPSEDWASFFGSQRILPQVRRAQSSLGPALVRRLETLVDNLETRLGAAEPPARLHGDLWAGNRIVDDAGRPWLVDPAVAGGHREMDLAMMQLFGGFGIRCFAAYAEALPLAEGHEDRVPLYQLYYLLVHVNLFGAGWVGRVNDALRQVGV